MEDDYNCSIVLPPGKETLIFRLKLSLDCIGVVLSLLTIINLIPKRQMLMFRIILYAMVANLLKVSVQLMENLPAYSDDDADEFSNGSRWQQVCEGMGFMNQVTAWMGHLCMTWIIVYFMYLLITKRRMNISGWSKKEIVGIAVCYLVPFVFNWIPFLGGYYGFSGGWCWITLTDGDCNITTRQMCIIVLFYALLLFFLLFIVVTCVGLFIRLVTAHRYRAKGTLCVLLYPFIYGMLFMIVTVSRIYSISEIKNRGEQSYQWWMVHAVVEPLCVILPSMWVFVTLISSYLIARCRTSISTIMDINGDWTNDDDGEKAKLVRRRT